MDTAKRHPGYLIQVAESSVPDCGLGAENMIHRCLWLPLASAVRLEGMRRMWSAVGVLRRVPKAEGAALNLDFRLHSIS